MWSSHAFCVCGLSPAGLWTHPDDRSVHYLDLEYWTDFARRVEAGGLDGIFMADALGLHDLYGGSPAAALRNGVQSPLIDPLLVIPAMAAVTGTSASESRCRRPTSCPTSWRAGSPCSTT